MLLRLSAVSAEQWIFMAPVGRAFFDGRRMRTITQEQAEAILANTQKAMDFFESNAPEGKTPYRFPVKTDHQGAERNGDLLAVRLAGDGPLYGFYGRVRWNPDAQKAVEARRIQHVSIGIGASYHLDDGRRLGPLVDEVSVTAEPRITSIGTIQDTLTLRLSRSRLTEAKVEELIALMKSIAETQNKQGGQIEALGSAVMELVEGEPEEAPDPPDVEGSGGGEGEPENPPVKGSNEPEDDEETRASLKAIREMLEANNKKQEENGAAIQALEARLSRLNLSQRGNAPNQPKPPGPVTRESRKAELMAQGVDPIEVVRRLAEEGL